MAAFRPVWFLSVLLLLGGCTVPHPGPRLPDTVTAPVASASITLGDRFLYSDPPVSSHYPNSWTILENEGYKVAYDETFKNPAWVAYHLPGREGMAIDRPGTSYPTDTRTDSKVTASDYPSGYDHGHMAPNYAISYFYGDSAQAETFLMSNMVVQRPGLNRGPWKSGETMEYSKWAKPGHDLWVICGPVYTTSDDEAVNPSNRYGTKQVCIPVACFKIVERVDSHGQVETLAFIMPQEDAAGHTPAEFLTSIREIERRTGLNFFSSLQQVNQDLIETGQALDVWK